MADLAPGLEYKAVQADNAEEGRYEGHFSVFGNADDNRIPDIVHPGAFSQTIAEDGPRIKLFYGHDPFKLIGPAPDVLREDAKGLFAAGRITLKSMWGREAWELMKDGALDEGSFGYKARGWDLEDKDGRLVRNLRNVKLIEISPVPLGMNALTSIRAVKAALHALEGPEAMGAQIGEQMVLHAQALTRLVAEVKAGNALVSFPKDHIAKIVETLTGITDALAELGQSQEPRDTQRKSSVLTYRMRAAELALALHNHARSI